MREQLLILVFVILSLPSFSQKANGGRGPSLGVNFVLTDPQSEFSENYEGTLKGYSFNFSNQLLFLPIDWGVQFSKSSMEPISEVVDIFRAVTLGGDSLVETAKLTLGGNISQYQGFLRLRPLNGKVQPYLDFVIGYSKYKAFQILEVEEEEKDILQQNSTWNIAYAVGLRFRVFPHVFLDFKMESQTGGDLQWTDLRSSIIEQTGNLNLKEIVTNSDQFKTYLGLSVSF